MLSLNSVSPRHTVPAGFPGVLTNTTRMVLAFALLVMGLARLPGLGAANPRLPNPLFLMADDRSSPLGGMPGGSAIGQAPYEPTWESVNRHNPGGTAPEWIKDGKFGIYFH